MSKENMCQRCGDTAIAITRCCHLGCTFEVASCPKCDASIPIQNHMAQHELECKWVPSAKQKFW